VYAWDEDKREANLMKHGLDFVDAYLVFENPAKVTFPSPQRGENRRVDIALVEFAGRVLALVYVERGGDIRVILFRVASRVERRMYGEARQQD
jgi:uncharacterized DUF497 family protein